MLISPPSEKGTAMEANAISAAKRAGVKHIGEFSADGADLEIACTICPGMPRSEKDIQSSGMAWTILRPTYFMQNLLGLAGMIKGTIYYDTAIGKSGSY